MQDNNTAIMQTKRHARWALMTMYFFSGFVYATLFSRYPDIKDLYHFGVGSEGDSKLGLMQFCMSIGSLLCMPVCANLANKYGSNKLSKMGFIVATIFIMIPIVQKFQFLLPVCVAYGAFASIYDIAINGNSILVEQSYKRAILSKFHAMYYVGTCLGAILSILFISFKVPVNVHFTIASILVFCELTIVRPFLLREKVQKKEEKKGFKLLFPKGILLLIAAIALFSRVIEGVVATWSTKYMNDVIELTRNLAPVGLAVYACFMAIGRFCGDIIRNKFHDAYILMMCSLCAAVGLALMVCSTMPILSILGLLITGLGMSCLVPIIYSLAGSQEGVSPGTGIAMVNTISGTGFLFGPFLISIISEHFGLRISFTYVLCLSLAMLVLANIFWRRSKSPTKR